MAIGKRIRAVTLSAAATIREWIGQGRYPVGAFLESETRLAEELAVSRGTVRQAIDLLVATGELTRQAHCRPTIGLPKDQSPRRNGLAIYVWVSHPISDSASLMFMKGVSLGLKGTPYRMIVREPTRFYGDHVHSDERQFLMDLLNDQDAAGAIVQRDPSADNRDIVEALIQKGVRIVFVDSPPPPDIMADFIGTANRSAARRGVEHLIDLGHRRIVCAIDNDFSEVTRERVRGYERAMAFAGLKEFERCLVAAQLPDVPGQYVPTGRFAGRLKRDSIYVSWAQRIVAALLATEDRPTALFVGCDVLAQSVCALLEGAGLIVPEDISVVGFDWLARWEPPLLDDLTTAGQDFEGFGWYAAELLLNRLSEEMPFLPRHILLPAPLVTRSSTARPSASAVPSASEILGNAAPVKS